MPHQASPRAGLFSRACPQAVDRGDYRHSGWRGGGLPCLHVVMDLCNPHHPRFALLPPRGGGQCVAIGYAPTGHRWRRPRVLDLRWTQHPEHEHRTCAASELPLTAAIWSKQVGFNKAHDPEPLPIGYRHAGEGPGGATEGSLRNSVSFEGVSPSRQRRFGMASADTHLSVDRSPFTTRTRR